jgi:hypothetical protein
MRRPLRVHLFFAAVLLVCGQIVAPMAALAQSADRFAVAIGHALPTQAKFGFFPTVRVEWYPTSPRDPLGLLVDVYVARAFPSTSSIRDIGQRWYHGTEYGAAVSLVAQPNPRKTVGPYLVVGFLHRVSTARDSTWTPPSYGVSSGTVSADEPNVGVGARVNLASGRILRFEIRYYDGLVFFPLTVGLTF